MEIWILLDSACTNINDTIMSIKHNTMQPQRIINATQNDFISALKLIHEKKGDAKNIYLLSICGPIPVHLIAYYVEIITNNSGLQLYGLSGFIMNEDLNMSMDIEFQALINGHEYEKRCRIATTHTHMYNVHWLERYATMLIPLDAIDDDFIRFPIEITMPELSFCNYMASKNIRCVQLCSLDLNICMFHKQHFTKYIYGTANPQQKEHDVNIVIRRYQDLKLFYLW